MKQKLAAIISLIALTFIMTLASCAPITENTDEDSSQITIKLPPIASYSIRALTTEQVSRLQRETAKYRVTFSEAGQTITREGDGTTFSAIFPTGAQVGVTVYCLNTKGEVIVKTVTKNITISSGANSLSFKLSEDGEEIEVNQEDPPNTDTPGDGDTPTTPPTTDTPGGDTPGGDNPPTPQPALYSITYNWGSVTPTSGDLPDAQNNITSGTSATIDIPTVQADYTFLGWSETEGAASATYKTGANTIQSVTKDYTLYAVWARTVLYESGLFVINELPANCKPDATKTVYEAMKDDGSNYDFSSNTNVLWYDNRASITSIEIGSNITPTSTAYWFYEMLYCTSIINLTILDTSNVTNMSSMFYNCSGLTSLDVSNFDTSNVTSMQNMFGYCSKLTSLDPSNFDTSNVTNMQDMFSTCSGLTSLDVSNFDTSNVTNMSNMFYQCSKLTSLDVSSFDTSNVTDMGEMFYSCRVLTSLDLSNFNTSNVTQMIYMFRYCSGLTSLDVSSFDTSNVTHMSGMFEGCSGLTSLNISNFNTSNVTSMIGMFNDCSGLTSLDVSNFDTSNVTSMNSMFYQCSGLTSLNVSNFNTSNVTNMVYMFRYCSGLRSLDLSNFDTSKVTSMSSMFQGCSGLTSLDVSSFDTSNVTSMTNMFNGCSTLATIYASSSFVTSSVTSSGSSNMFNGCGALTGGQNTTYDASNVDKTYARIDGGTAKPGYFTDIADKH